MTAQVWGINVELSFGERVGQLTITLAVFAHAMGNENIGTRAGRITAPPLSAKNSVTVSG
jgi:hypothetical protein